MKTIITKKWTTGGVVRYVVIFTTAMISLGTMCALFAGRRCRNSKGRGKSMVKQLIDKDGISPEDYERGNIYIYRCDICGQTVLSKDKLENPLYCCSAQMRELEPCSVEASAEKHIPVHERHGDTFVIKVGSEKHPMLPEHHIVWIALVTDIGMHAIFLNTNSDPEACFELAPNERPLSVYALCNLHGLWKEDVND